MISERKFYEQVGLELKRLRYEYNMKNKLDINDYILQCSTFGVQYSTVKAYEKGTTKVPLFKLIEMLKKYDLTIGDFVKIVNLELEMKN